MLHVNQLIGFGARRAVAAAGGVFRESRTSNVDGNSFTFNSVDFGAADADRYIVIVASCTRTAVGTIIFGSATAGGVTMTKASRLGITAISTIGTNGFIVVLYANVPSGSTGTVVINLLGGSNNADCCAISVYSVPGPIYVLDADTTNSSGTLSSDYDNGGIIVAGALTNSVTTVALSGVTYDSQDLSADTGHSTSVGHQEYVSSGTESIDSDRNYIVAASFSLTEPTTSFFQQSANSATSSTTITFSSVALGTADTNRLCIVAFSNCRSGASGASGFTSITAGGVTLTQGAIANDTTGGDSTLAIYYGVVPTGTTGDVVITSSGNTRDRHAIAVYTIPWLSSTTPSDTGSTANTDNATTTLDYVAGGLVVVAAFDRDDALANVTISGGVDIDAADVTPGSSSKTTFGSLLPTTSGTLSLGTNAENIVAVAWAP